MNNFLYDLSEIPDSDRQRRSRSALERPRHWDMKSIRNFMLVVGPVSSIFDFLTFYVMLHVFHAGEALFHTGWFVESLATQVLVIFVIRTRGNPLRSKPSAILTATSLVVVARGNPAARIPRWVRALGFVPLPGLFFLILAGMVAAYLVAVQAAKTWFYRRFAEPAR